MTAEEGLQAVKEYVQKYEHNSPRDVRDKDWQRGADWIRTQVFALIVEHIEPNLTLPSGVENSERVGV